MAHAQPPPNLDQARTSMAAERTWVAWWRTGLAARLSPSAGSAEPPRRLVAARLGYAALAVVLMVVGARRQHERERAFLAGAMFHCGTAPSGSSRSPASRWSC